MPITGARSAYVWATGIPTLVINGDLCDLRFYSDVQVKTSIEAFTEQLSGS